jgi:hypothetical protein
MWNVWALQETGMKLLGILGAILVIAGVLGLAQPILSSAQIGPGVNLDKDHHHLTYVEQCAGGLGIVIGFVLIGLDISRHE